MSVSVCRWWKWIEQVLKKNLNFLDTHSCTHTGGFANLLVLFCVWCVSAKVISKTVSESMAIYLRALVCCSFPFRCHFALFNVCFFSLLFNARVIASFQSKNHNLIYIQLNIPMLLLLDAGSVCAFWDRGLDLNMYLYCVCVCVYKYHMNVSARRIRNQCEIVLNEYNFRRKFHLITQRNHWIDVAKSWGHEKAKAIHGFLRHLFASAPWFRWLKREGEEEKKFSVEFMAALWQILSFKWFIYFQCGFWENFTQI